MEENKREEGINVMVEQVHFPSFKEFCHVNESVDAEMTLYSEIASRVDQLKQIYGEKSIGKTGIMKALLSINELILTGKKESQSQSTQQTQPAQPAIQPQSIQTQSTQPQTQSTQPQTQPQSTQPQSAQSQSQLIQPQPQSQSQKETK